MRGFFFLLACVGVAPAVAQQPDSMPAATLQVSLDEAVRRALVVQPAMVQAEGDRRNTSAGMRSAFGAFLPTLASNASASRSNQGRIDFTTGQPIPPQYTYTVGLSASLDLFDGFRRPQTATRPMPG
jgi:outer membrane protein TolC